MATISIHALNDLRARLIREIQQSIRDDGPGAPTAWRFEALNNIGVYDLIVGNYDPAFLQPMPKEAIETHKRITGFKDRDGWIEDVNIPEDRLYGVTRTT